MGMSSQRRISVSFSKEYKVEYDFLIEQNNASDYICKAVRKSLQADKEADKNIDNKIHTAVDAILKDMGLVRNFGAMSQKSGEEYEFELTQAANLFDD